jgi:hypothetical protein
MDRQTARDFSGVRAATYWALLLCWLVACATAALVFVWVQFSPRNAAIHQLHRFVITNLQRRLSRVWHSSVYFICTFLLLLGVPCARATGKCSHRRAALANQAKLHSAARVAHRRVSEMKALCKVDWKQAERSFFSMCALHLNSSSFILWECTSLVTSARKRELFMWSLYGIRLLHIFDFLIVSS